MEYSKICAVFGEDPSELAFGYDEEYYTCDVLKMRLVSAMQNAALSGCDAFALILNQGVCMWGAEACIAMRESGENLGLIVMTRSETQASRWHPERRERFYNIIEKCDEHTDLKGISDVPEEYLIRKAKYAIILGNSNIERIAKIADLAERAGVFMVVIPSE